MPGHGGKRANAGRPPGPPTERFVVRIPVDVAARFDEAATARGESRTEALRAMIFRAAQRAERGG